MGSSSVSHQELPPAGIDTLCAHYREELKALIQNKYKKIDPVTMGRLWKTAIYDEFQSTLLSLYVSDTDWLTLTLPIQYGVVCRDWSLPELFMKHEFYFLASEIFKSIEDEIAKNQFSFYVKTSIVEDFNYISELSKNNSDIQQSSHELFSKILALMPFFKNGRRMTAPLHNCLNDCIEIAVILDEAYAVRLLDEFRKCEIHFLPEISGGGDPYTVAVGKQRRAVIDFYKMHYPDIATPEIVPIERRLNVKLLQ